MSEDQSKAQPKKSAAKGAGSENKPDRSPSKGTPLLPGRRGSAKTRDKLAATRNREEPSISKTPAAIALKRELPEQVTDALRKRGVEDEHIKMATDTDLDITGEYSEAWVVVTDTHVLVYWVDPEEDAAILSKEVVIAEIDGVRTDTRVGSGFLEVKTGDVYEEIARYSNRHGEKFAKVASQLNSLSGGRDITVKPEAEVAEDLLKNRPEMRVRRGTVFMRFLKYTRNYNLAMAVAMALVVLTIAIILFPQQLVKVLVDQVMEGNVEGAPGWFDGLTALFGLRPTPEEPVSAVRLQWLYLLVGMLAFTTLLGAVIGVMRESLSVWISNHLGFEMRRRVFEKLQDLEVRYHEDRPVGSLMTRCSQDIETLQSFPNQLTGGLVFQLLQVIGVAAVMFWMNWRLGLIACVPAPIVMFSTVVFYRWVVPKWRKYWTARSDLNSSLFAVLSGVRVVKAFAQERREGTRFQKVSSGFFKAGTNVGYAQAMFYPPMGFVFQLGSYFIWVSGGTQLLTPGESSISIGELIAFLGYLGMFYAPLNSLTQMSTWFTQFTTQAHRVFEVLDQDTEIEDDADAVDIEIQGSISFNDVTFGYDPHIPVLKNVTFDIHPGEMIGIVGHSGCGKSTTVGLIMRFYDPSEGEVVVDSIELHKVKKHCLRRQIGLVAQDPHLFRGTVAENIAYGNPDVAPERLLNAALQANAHMFITRNHDGYDSRIGERGAGLSGGERQRVAISRALVTNPRILILDEATSSVDTISEREIQNALEALSRGRTTIAIAHRLSTLKNCDRILVFEEGEIREQGSHEELMGVRGIYWRLVQTQMELAIGPGATEEEATGIETTASQAAPRRPRHSQVPQIRYLDPKKLHVHTLEQGDLRITYGEEEYDHVRAYRCFPVSRPSEFIALWTGDTALEHHEVGVVRRLKELSPSSRMAIEYELQKRYFIHYIQEIHSIRESRENIGFLVWEVTTDKGEMQFVTRRFDRHAVVEGGRNGRIIFDIDDNRYEIVDIDELDKDSRAVFQTHIYW